MHNNIQHKGIVDSVSKGVVVVRVTQLPACSSCQLSGRCHSAEGRDKLIEVLSDVADSYRVGDMVLVSADAQVGRLAVLVGFVLPMVLLVGVTVFMHQLVGEDTVAALCGLGALIPYYVVLRFFRGRLQGLVTFHLRKVFGTEENNNNQRIQETL